MHDIRQIRDLLLGIPNLPYDDVHVGPDETANVEIRPDGYRGADRGSIS